MKKIAKKIWMKVSMDEYELPVTVADTAAELAELCHITVGSIYSQMSRVRHGKLASCPYVCISI